MDRIMIYGLSPVLGGTESFVLTLYRALDKTKIQFDFIFPHDTNEIPYENEIINAGGRIYREYYRKIEKHLVNHISIKELFNKHPEWKGVYINIQSLDTSYRLLVEAYKRNVKYRLMHIHSSGYSKKRRIRDNIYKIYYMFTRNAVVTNFLACSDLSGRWIYGNKKYTIIPNAIDFTKFRFNDDVRNKLRTFYNIDNSAIVIGFCARLVRIKNPIFAFEVFCEIQKMNKNTYFLIVGDGGEREKVKQLIFQNGLNDRVIITGSVNNVNEYMQMMDCLILPSQFEGFGIVLLEAQAAGLNCFASKYVIPKETNVTGKVNFIELNNSPQEWAKEIISIGFNREDYCDVLMKSEYTIESVVDKINEIFSLKRVHINENIFE